MPIEIKEEELLNEGGHCFGSMVTATFSEPDTRNDALDALSEKYGEEALFNHKGDVWNQFRWQIIKA
jgi:hypothetical protein